MFKVRDLVAAALMVVVGSASTASAQSEKQLKAPFVWTSADGGLHFTVPAGWYRIDTSAVKNVVLDVAKGDQAPNDSGVHCAVTIQVMGPAQPGSTQAAMNARMQAVGASITALDEKRIATSGGVSTIDGFLAGQGLPRILIVMRAIYLRGGKIYNAETRCGRTHPPSVLTSSDLKTARIFFDTISVTP